MDEDFFIKILKYLKWKGLEPTSVKEIYQLALKNHLLTKEEYEQINSDPRDGSTELGLKLDRIYYLFQECTHLGQCEPDTDHRVMTLDGYFKLLEHDELKEARKSSRFAQVSSVIAIIISIITMVISIYFSLEQIKLATDSTPNKVVVTNWGQVDGRLSK